MGPSLGFEEGLSAEFMFGLLGYSTWNIYKGKEWIGQVTLNEMDRTASFTVEREATWVIDELYGHSWEWWMKWLRKHRHEPF